MKFTHFILVAALTAAMAIASFGQNSSDIRKSDFKNFTYPAYCAREQPEKIPVKNGEYSKEAQQDGYVDRVWFKVFSIKFGDLTGDKRDEAIVLSTCNTGGTGYFSEGYIYSMAAGQPKLIARIGGGDRADGGLRDATVENGFLIVESNDAGNDGGACCPQFIVTQRYKLTGRKLMNVGKPRRSSVPPDENIR